MGKYTHHLGDNLLTLARAGRAKNHAIQQW